MILIMFKTKLFLLLFFLLLLLFLLNTTSARSVSLAFILIIRRLGLSGLLAWSLSEPLRKLCCKYNDCSSKIKTRPTHPSPCRSIRPSSPSRSSPGARRRGRPSLPRRAFSCRRMSWCPYVSRTLSTSGSWEDTSLSEL